MRKKTSPLKRCLVLTAMALASADALALKWQDSSLSYTVSDQFTEPGVPVEVTKHIVEYVHVNGYRLGNNMLRFKMMKSDDNDPTASGNEGATELYAVYRHYLSFGALAEKSLGFGPVRDIGLTAGFDINTKNNAFGPRKRMFVLGPTLMFDVPKRSMLQLSLLANKEYNHCGLPPCSAPGNHNDYEFDTYPMLFTAWHFPIQLGRIGTKFEGFALKGYRRGVDYVGNKVGHETLIRAAWLVDVGQLADSQAGKVYAGIGYEYWRNKYGANGIPGTSTNAPTLQLKWHF